MLALGAPELDDGPAGAQYVSAAALVWFDWNWEASEREFKRAIELNPHYAVAHHWYGSCCSRRRADSTRPWTARRALELEPLSLVINSNDGVHLLPGGPLR